MFSRGIHSVLKKGELALFELLEGLELVKRGELFFSGGEGSEDFLKVIFNCWSNITQDKKISIM